MHFNSYSPHVNKPPYFSTRFRHQTSYRSFAVPNSFAWDLHGSLYCIINSIWWDYGQNRRNHSVNNSVNKYAMKYFPRTCSALQRKKNPPIVGKRCQCPPYSMGEHAHQRQGSDFLGIISDAELEIFNRGNTPKFHNKHWSEVPDLPLCSVELRNRRMIESLRWGVSFRPQACLVSRGLEETYCLGNEESKMRNTLWEPFKAELQASSYKLWRQFYCLTGIDQI